MVKYISQSFTTEHSTAKKTIKPKTKKTHFTYRGEKISNSNSHQVKGLYFSKYKVKTVSWKISKSSVSDLAYLYEFQYLSNLKLCNNKAHP